MNYPNPQSGYDRPRRKPNFFLLMILGAMAFYLYTQYQASKRRQAEVPEIVMPEIIIPDISNDDRSGSANGLEVPDWRHPNARPAPSKSADANKNRDWSIGTDEPTSPNTDAVPIPSRRSTTPSNSSVRRGDWQLDEGNSYPNGDSKTRVVTPPKSKSTRNGDWSIEEVETKKE